MSYFNKTINEYGPNQFIGDFIGLVKWGYDVTIEANPEITIYPLKRGNISIEVYL